MVAEKSAAARQAAGCGNELSTIGSEALHRLLKRLPEWLRSDLASSDASHRARAEDALLAMLLASRQDESL